MEFNISNEKKRITVDNLIEQCECDIFKLALVLDIVPETLDINWTPPEGHSLNENVATQLVYELGRLKALKARREALG